MGEARQKEQVQTAERKRGWLATFLRSQLFGALLGVILALVPPTVYQFFVAPDSQEIVTVMSEEVRAAQTHDAQLVAQIYLSSAIVTDSACLAQTQPTVFNGLPAIQARYQQLPDIPTLAHIKVTVEWDSDWRRLSRYTVTQATATSATVGVLRAPSAAGPPVYQQISGYEVWSFVKVNGAWRISAFTFGLCSV